MLDKERNRKNWNWNTSQNLMVLIRYWRIRCEGEGLSAKATGA